MHRKKCLENLQKCLAIAFLYFLFRFPKHDTQVPQMAAQDWKVLLKMAKVIPCIRLQYWSLSGASRTGRIYMMMYALRLRQVAGRTAPYGGASYVHYLQPFHISLHQGLLPGDCEKRFEFSNWFLNMVDKDENIAIRSRLPMKQIFHAMTR